VKLYLFHTPEQVPDAPAPDCAIAVDVLRATTTIATALHNGAEAVQAFSSVDQLMQVSDAWPAEQRIRAGERGGSKLEGCDLGNSPLDCTAEYVGGKRLFITTTNGTRCLERIQSAVTVLTAALVNRRAVVQHLLHTRPETVWIVGSGWEGTYSLEDTVCGGAIAYSIANQLRESSDAHGLGAIAGNDELVAAVSLYEQWRDRLLDLMYLASHGKRLVRLECFDDLKFCAQTDTLDLVPIQKEPGVLVKSYSNA